MLFILNQVGVRNDGGVEGKLSGTVDGFAKGQGYIAGKPFVATAAVASTDAWVGGFRYSSTGALRVFDAGAGAPAGSSHNAGILMTATGQACFIDTASASNTGSAITGITVDSVGRFYMKLTA